jgi:hypothetical protein
MELRAVYLAVLFVGKSRNNIRDGRHLQSDTLMSNEVAILTHDAQSVDDLS